MSIEDEAVYILTKMKLENYLKTKGKYIKLTYSELLDFTIKALKLIEQMKGEYDEREFIENN